MSQPPMFKQVTFFGSGDTGQLRDPADVPIEQRQILYDKFQAGLLEWNDGNPLARNLNEFFIPLFVYTDAKQVERLKAIQSALDKAVVHLIENWWTDEEKHYPQRMPIERHQEDLLRVSIRGVYKNYVLNTCQWVSDPEKSHIPPYAQRRDVQRPDFLIEKADGPNGSTERIKICEINGRFPYNGFFLVCMMEYAAAKVFPDRLGMTFDLDEQTVLDKLIGFWDTSKPLHIIEDGFNNADVYIFARKYGEITGQSVILITPTDIVLAADADSETGKSLFCRKIAINGGRQEPTVKMERIYQCSIEPHTPEQAHYSMEILQHLARISVNDMRTSFLANDKRMLGVIYEEIESLTIKQVLTPEDAEVLRDALIPTYLPGSGALRRILRKSHDDPHIKDNFIIKAVRGAGSRDIYYGSNLSQEEWLAYVEPLARANIAVGEQKYLLQDALTQMEYDIVRTRVSEETEKFCLNGTFHTISGHYVGIGPWRITYNRELIPLLSGNNVIMISVVDRKK